MDNIRRKYMPRVQVEPYFTNTTQEAYYSDVDNRMMGYFIHPIDGYVLHDNAYDMDAFDPETGELTGEINLGYTGGSISVGRNYNFAENPREIYAVLRSEVDENYIFGDGDSGNHEVM
jgi:hypothetical protein